MDIEIKRLSPELLDDYLYFFDRVAFSDNREWEGCYCVFFHHHGSERDWYSRSKEDNRETAARLITEGRLRGFLAYHGGAPVAWCNANDKAAYSFEKNRADAPGAFDDETASIVCFLVSPACRMQGISGRLLDSVIEYYRASGKKYLEAYPAKNASGPSGNYHGPLSLFLKKGFATDRESETYHVVTLDLRK